MLITAFWTLVAIDTIALGVLCVMAARGPKNPEGMVGAWLVILPILLIAGCAVLGVVAKSNTTRVVGMCLLGFPWVIAIAGPGYNAWRRYNSERAYMGDDDFRGPQRALAHAIIAQDVTLVRSLIPNAGDLNKQYGDQTLLEFAVHKAGVAGESKASESAQIVQALLDGGANPDREPVRARPLTLALIGARHLVEMLLKAGAKPNYIDDMGRPIWWDVLSGDSDEKISTLAVLLDHGADVKLRSRDEGCVAFAAKGAHATTGSKWMAVWMLVERGAAWRGEQSFGESVESMLMSDIQEREKSGGVGVVSEEMRKLKGKFEEGK